MKCLFAPMEGITGYVFRGVHHQFYDHIESYYTPFITPTRTRKLTTREWKDVLPEHNTGIPVVPQILTNNAEDFLWAADKLQSMGYEEVNLNLGCPSGTVVPKNRGAGFLAMPCELDCFLDQVREPLQRMNMQFSIKTRIGRDTPEEFEDLLKIFNRYPLKELIIHPRIRTDYYKNHPNLDVFAMAVEESKNPLCYNGDLFSVKDFRQFQARFPQVRKVMLGRGLLANPALAAEICISPETEQNQTELSLATLRSYHDTLLNAYARVLSGDRNVLFKMKELWSYMGDAFENSEKYVKKIRKSQSRSDYEVMVSRLFTECPLADQPGFRGWKNA